MYMKKTDTHLYHGARGRGDGMEGGGSGEEGESSLHIYICMLLMQ